MSKYCDSIFIDHLKCHLSLDSKISLLTESLKAQTKSSTLIGRSMPRECRVIGGRARSRRDYHWREHCHWRATQAQVSECGPSRSGGNSIRDLVAEGEDNKQTSKAYDRTARRCCLQTEWVVSGDEEEERMSKEKAEEERKREG